MTAPFLNLNVRHQAWYVNRIVPGPSAANFLEAAARPDSKTMAEIDESLSGIPPSAQRRLLRYFNRARTPEDLAKFPQEIALAYEHEVHEGQQLNIDQRLFRQERQDLQGFDIPKIEIDPDLAELVISRRPLEGYIDLRTIFMLDWERWRHSLDFFCLFLVPGYLANGTSPFRSKRMA